MPDTCPKCGETLKTGDWPWCPGGGGPHGRTLRTAHSIHERERAAVYRNPTTGQVAYPGVNDHNKTQARYEKMGFERQEMNSLRELDSFCAQEEVRSDVADFHPGNRD